MPTNCFITIKAKDLSVRSYSTEQEALKHSSMLNFVDREDPVFNLFELKGQEVALYKGRLRRDFGSNTLYWSME